MMPLESALEPVDDHDAIASAAPGDRAGDAAGGRVRRLFRRCRSAAAALGAALEWLFGLASVMVGLAVLASIPILQLISLGYLLESSGRVVRSGRLRAGFLGM